MILIRPHLTYLCLIAFVSCFCIAALPAHAESKSDAAARLKSVEDQISAQKAEREKLADQIKDLEDELDDLRGAIVGKATSLKKQERKVTDIEDKVSALEHDRQATLQKLKAEQAKLGDLISALIRIRRTPPEALIAKPGAPLQAAQTALILRGVVDPIQKKTEELQTELVKLDTIEAALHEQKKNLTTQFGRLDVDQQKLDALIKKRTALYNQTRAHLKTRDSEIASLSRQAEDVRDLIARLDAKRRSDDEGSDPTPKTRDRAKGRSVLPKSLGDKQLPVSGVVRVGFGGTSDWGTRSEGIVIEGRQGAVVVAPMNGVVRYTGPFKSYGNLVIIEHQGGYHSLVAGLGKIDTVEGARVDAGEPLGTLSTRAKGRPDVYFELRRNGQPINPSRQFPELG